VLNTGRDKECFIEGVSGVFGREALLLSAGLVNASGFVMILDKDLFFPPKRENSEKKPFCCLGVFRALEFSKPTTRGASGGVAMKNARVGELSTTCALVPVDFDPLPRSTIGHPTGNAEAGEAIEYSTPVYRIKEE